MTNTRSDLSLSRLEQIVLARLSCAKPPSEKLVADAVAEFAVRGKEANASNIATTTLAQLKKRGLINEQRNILTDSGARALRSAFDVNKTPLWKEVHTSHLLARSLGLEPGSATAQKIMKDANTIARALVGTSPRSVKQAKAVDKLIVDALKLTAGPLDLTRLRIEIANRIIITTLSMQPGPVTLARMRAHIAGQPDAGPNSATSKHILIERASKIIGEPCHDKRSMSRALIRRWVYEVAPGIQVTSTPHAAANQLGLGFPKPLTQPPISLPVTPPSARSQAEATTMAPSSLIDLVRSALPQIGADGRFGAEKVFVSALWHRIERDARPSDLSLAGFKTWLITANREQLLDLARADLVGAMDPKLVAESEIKDLGATFHFVVDRRNATGRGTYAR